MATGDAMLNQLAIFPLVVVLACVAAVPASSYSAAANGGGAVETCFGQTATIVSEVDAFETLGTSGPDVIVSFGVGDIDSGDGDDLVCVFGEPKSERERYSRFIETGDGNDQVDTRGSGHNAYATLGAGADLYEGGRGWDMVLAGAWKRGHIDTEFDVIRTGDGPDTVTTGGGSDTVVLDAGRDSLTLEGVPSPDAVLDGGSGSNLLDMTLSGAVRQSWRIDNLAERLYGDGRKLARWDNFTRFAVYAERDSIFIGSGMDESLMVGLNRPPTPDELHKLPRWPIEVRMGGGDDGVLFFGGPNGTRLWGGPGTDNLRYVTFARGGKHVSSDVSLDLAVGRLVDRETNWLRHWKVLEFENAGVANGDEWKGNGSTSIRGTDGPNALKVPRDGADATVYGASGDDVLLGGSGDDTLQGGKGRDSANGREGLDRCEAEVVALCETVR